MEAAGCLGGNVCLKFAVALLLVMSASSERRLPP